MERATLARSLNRVFISLWVEAMWVLRVEEILPLFLLLMNPLEPISNGQRVTVKPRSSRSDCRGRYFFIFLRLASSVLVSKETVSSRMEMIFLSILNMTRSGLCEVRRMLGGIV